MKKLLLTFILLILPFAVHATDPAARTDKALLMGLMDAGCGNMTEAANVSVNFNSIEKDLDEANNMFEGKVKAIQKAADALKLEKLEVQSLNYNLYPQNNGGGSAIQWQLNGSVSFQIEPSSRAKDLVKLLVEQGLQPTLSINAYRNGACQ